MSQITIYIPDDIARQLKRAARKAKKSLSAYLVDLARPAGDKPWPESFFKLQGSCAGSLAAPDDPPPDEPGDY